MLHDEFAIACLLFVVCGSFMVLLIYWFVGVCAYCCGYLMLWFAAIVARYMWLLLWLLFV